MPRRRRLALTLTLALPALALTLPEVGCKARSGAAEGEASTPTGDAGGGAAVALPEPYPIEASPALGAYVGDPEGTLAVATQLVPGVPPRANVAALLIATQAPAELAERLAPMIAGDRPWVGGRVAGEDILHLPLEPGQEDAAAALLTAYPGEAGGFGAVVLPGIGVDVDQLVGKTPPPALGEAGEADDAEPRLLWIDRELGGVTIARSGRGLVTARGLLGVFAGRAGGETPGGGLWLGVAGDFLGEYIEGFPYARIDAAGAGLDDLTVTIDADPERGLPRSPELAAGALTNLHGGPELAVAGSTRWARHSEAVSRLIREINAQVAGAGLAKMMIEPLAKQAIAALRTWNGRVFLGIGPARHLALGLGADDPERAKTALTRFLRSAVDNLELLRMFTSDVPKVSLRRIAGEPEVHEITISGAKKMIPPAFAGLLDDRGALRIAYAASAPGGALYAVIGADALARNQAWSTAIAGAPPASESLGDLFAVTVALSPAQLQGLLARADPNDVTALLGASLDLSPGRPPTEIVAREEASRYVITSRGPAR